MAYEINDKGQIVGYSRFNLPQDSEGQYNATLWDNGEIIDLGTLPGGPNSVATAINDKGDIVGYRNTQYEQYHAVLWYNRKI